MNNNKFEEQLKKDFINEVPDVLSNIKQSERFMVPEKPARNSILHVFKFRSFRYSLVSAFMILILAVFMIRGNTENQVYASTVTIDINPQIEIMLDEDDTVISVQALNDDGIVIIEKDITYKGMTLDVFIEYLVDRLDQAGYIVSTEDNVVMIYVDGVNAEIQDRVLSKVQAKMQLQAQKINKVMEFVRTNDIELTDDQLSEVLRLSEEYKINPGRIILIQQIRSYDDSYTIRELSTMTMRELNSLRLQLEEQGESTDRPYRNNSEIKVEPFSSTFYLSFIVFYCTIVHS